MKVKKRRNVKSNMFLNIVLCSVFLLLFLLFLFVPKIYLKGDSKVTVNINSKYEDKGIETNFLNEKEKKKIKVINNVNTSKKVLMKLNIFIKITYILMK